MFFIIAQYTFYFNKKTLKNRVSYYVGRKSWLTWVVTILLVFSAVCRIAFYCEWKGAGASTVWQMLILPLAAGIWFALILLAKGEEQLYRTGLPVTLWTVLIAVRIAQKLGGGWLLVLVWLAAAVFAGLYCVALGGKIRCAWLLGLAMLAVTGTQVWLYRVNLLRAFDPVNLKCQLAQISLALAFTLTVLFMRVHLDGRYHPTWGDRPDGRRLRNISPITYVGSFIMPNRNGASNNFRDSVEITGLEKYIHAKRREGLANFGITHALLATYVRTVAEYPGLNRFLAGQRIYSRDEDIQFCMIVKKDMTLDDPDTEIKLHLSPSDTVYDVYEKYNAAVEEVKHAPLDSTFDKTAHALMLIPGVLLKFVIWLLKLIDYFGLLPRFLLEVSPFHGSVFFTSMGSLGIPPIVHHLYDFGNLPVFIAFGRKRRAVELNADGEPIAKRYVDFTVNTDERIVDGFYYAAAIKYFERVLRHPEQLDTKPEHVKRDID